jgi:hypothetical protein
MAPPTSLARLAKQLDAVRDQPLRKVHLALQPAALPPHAVLAVSLTCDPLFAQPMRFFFAHYREGRTWPSWMRLDEPGRDEVRGDGKRVAGRFQWLEKAIPLREELDETELRDRPAAFTLELSSDARQPKVSLSALVARGASFGVTILGEQQGAERRIVSEENDLDLRVTALHDSGPRVTLFRSSHRPLERDVLGGELLSSIASEIEREAILGLYPPSIELAEAEARQRRERAQALLGAPEAALSPEERRIVATLRHGQAQLLVSRVFGSSPPPGPARRKLHAEATEACEAVWRLLSPLVATEPRFHDVGMAYWAASNLAIYHDTVRAPERARQHNEEALRLVEEAAARAPDEPEFGRWAASARERLRRAGAR